MKHRTSLHWIWLILVFPVLAFVVTEERAKADTNAPASARLSAAPDGTNSTNAPAETLLNAQAIEQLRRDIEATTARNTTAITSGLAMLEPALAQLHSRQMELVQSSNRTILIVAGLFTGVGFVALISIVFIVVRALGRFSEMAQASNRGGMLSTPAIPAALGPGDLVNVNATAVEQASARFQHAIEHLQKRIFELEHTAQPAAALEPGRPQPGAKPAPPEALSEPAMNISPLPPHDVEGRRGSDTTEATSRISLLLGKGQALLNLDQAAESLECFDEILVLDPNNTEALLRRGLALEKLESWEKALESYDRALLIDSSLTVAYLYKGGVCNKLQRHREALDSYEHALHTEKRSRAS
ncbi:MAG: hypothetical protein QOF48_1531 [Verrucomicrobiota bacterium]|jgi:tetratricopeptide (TPR) repeat protein